MKALLIAFGVVAVVIYATNSTIDLFWKIKGTVDKMRKKKK